jgi:transposase
MRRGQMSEFGKLVAQGPLHVNELVAELIEPQSVPEPLRQVLLGLVRLLAVLREQIAALDRQILAWHRSNECSRRLAGIDGFGPILSSAMAVRVQQSERFGGGRYLSAWIGLVPRQKLLGRQGTAGSNQQEERCLSAPVANQRRPGHAQQQTS